MLIAFVSADAALPLRSAQLRNGRGFEYCRFDSDNKAGTFHLAQVNEEGTVICVLSCHPNNKYPLNGTGYQLRGMATDAKYKGKGLGTALMTYCINYLKTMHVDYLWCNARFVAYHFYEHLGFRYMSDEFNIEDIGPHREMMLIINEE